MELPASLRQAVDAALEGVALADLKRASEMLSRRYRAETRDGRMHISDDLAAKAYLAARLPATYAAVRASMDSAAEVCPDFAPQSMLDVGAGPGTALWAARQCWPMLQSATMIEASPAIRAVGSGLSQNSGLPDLDWRAGDVVREKLDFPHADLVTIAYVLDELAPEKRQTLISRLWAAATQMLVIVEPGTPAGWQRILDARHTLIAEGAIIAAPCPHQLDCPLAAPDWCHFSRRVARSRIHRLTKDAEVPWEDEKFIYLAAVRETVNDVKARVIAPTRVGGGKVSVKLCKDDGRAEERLLTKREGDLFRWARRADWGDALIEE
ncbi:small ribosomal subunit Rsm22 family protein [Brucella sp. ZJ1_1]|uniref:Ribosomal small subunit Rsm22 n=3 Tax=Brucella intermedia TaxID=94625 RepID=C4WFJ5_9HYPH|nr:small ribosomal subunit Rsm22 family protein [Brucella intermedia]EEQ96292.1 Ribosomal small subunit Rsm22 [Brucella intermedia LMG 3301]ELT47241.1 ribosomal small subunit Rsm22 [Brucella intermedia M86]MCB4917396.1 methyltransferase type 11 [Brucella intermedia]OOC64616.1 methyltransferase type 11 [Brucella intermedia M86]SUB13277.1 Ketopantoate hydroxymethyltransferase [Brucella intermedia]